MSGSSGVEWWVHDAGHSTGVISSTGSCQVLTFEVSISQPYQYTDASSTLYDQACLPGCGGVRWGRPSIISLRPCARKDTPPVVPNAIFVRLRSLPNGYKNKAMPSARWMKTFYSAISPDFHATVPATCPKRPKAS